MPDQIRETAGSILEAASGTPSTYRVLIISEGRGSSGVYPRETLQEAARNRVIPAGTFSFVDHPTATDAMDRPERSVRDLAAVTTSDAQWSDEHNGLVAEMRVFGPYQQLLGELAEHIGLSILGDGEIETREGQRTVTHLAHVNSVDWVTRAGRGGKVLNLLEAARRPLAEARNVGQHLESRLHQDFTNRADDMAANGHLSREERIHLSGAVGQGLSAFAAHLEANAPQLYTRDIYDEPPAAPAVAEGAPAPTNPTEENLMPQIEEARLGQLEEAERRVPTLEAERDAATARATAAETALAVHEARQAARPAVAAQVAESTVLGPRAQARVVETVLAALPVVDGAIAEEARTAAVTAAVTAAEAEAAEYTAPARESYGAFGSANDKSGAAEITEADYDTASARTFGRTITGA